MPFKDIERRKEWEHKRKQSKKYIAYNRKWRLENKEYFTNWAKNNREKIRASVKKYRQSLQGKLINRIKSSNHRSLTKDLRIKTVQMVYEDNIKKFGTLTCYLCLNPILFGKDHLEHKTPLSRGGNSQYSNLAVACKKCNNKKSNKTVEEFRNVKSAGQSSKN